MSPSAYRALCFACTPSRKWLKSSLGDPLKNEDGAGRIREALDHLVGRRFHSSFVLEGRYEFPAFSGMLIEQMLYLI